MTPFEFLGEEYDLELYRTSYASNSSLAIVAKCNGKDFATITVNLPYAYLDSEREAFIDENNLPGITAWLKRNKLIAPAAGNDRHHSGFCEYRKWKFDIDRIPLTEQEKYLRSEEYVIDSVIKGNFTQARKRVRCYAHDPVSIIRNARENYSEEIAEKVASIILS